MGRKRLSGVAQKAVIKKTISQQDKRDLKVLADDFKLLHREDVQSIIKNCNTYDEGQRAIMRIYTALYM